MVRAQVVAILLAAPLTLIAQQDAGTHLTIQVTDMSGAPIPHAKVEIMSPEDGGLLEFAADSKGIADLHLGRRDYQYRVSYAAFCPNNGNLTAEICHSFPNRAQKKYFLECKYQDTQYQD